MSRWHRWGGVQAVRVRFRELTRRKVGRSLLAGSVCLVVVGLLISIQSGEEGTSSDPTWCGVMPAFLLDPLEDCSPGRQDLAFWLILAGLTLTAVSLLVFFPTVDQDHRSERIAFRWTRALLVLTPGLLLLPVATDVYESNPPRVEIRQPPMVPADSASWQSPPETCFLVPWEKQRSLLGEDLSIVEVRRGSTATRVDCSWRFEGETSDESMRLWTRATLHRDTATAKSRACPQSWDHERGAGDHLRCLHLDPETAEFAEGAIVVDNLEVEIELRGAAPNHRELLEDLLDLMGSEAKPA